MKAINQNRSHMTRLLLCFLDLSTQVNMSVCVHPVMHIAAVRILGGNSAVSVKCQAKPGQIIYPVSVSWTAWTSSPHLSERGQGPLVDSSLLGQFPVVSFQAFDPLSSLP